MSANEKTSFFKVSSALLFASWTFGFRNFSLKLAAMNASKIVCIPFKNP